jgi:hypothetical protein
MCSFTQPSSYRVMSTKSVTEVIIDGSREQYFRLEEIAQTLNVSADTLSTWARRFPSFPRLQLPGGAFAFAHLK